MSRSGTHPLKVQFDDSLQELPQLEDKIVLNSHELEIKEASITATETKTESTVNASSISYDDKARTATLDFGQKIKHDNGKSLLNMKFNGLLNNAMAGFYRSAYTDEKGEKKYMFSTQCEVPFYSLFNTYSRHATQGELSLGNSANTNS